MRIQIIPTVVDGETCVEAEVSVAVSNSVAIRAVPVDGNGVEHPDGARAFVGDDSRPDAAAFMVMVRDGAAALLG